MKPKTPFMYTVLCCFTFCKSIPSRKVIYYAHNFRTPDEVTLVLFQPHKFVCVPCCYCVLYEIMYCDKHGLWWHYVHTYWFRSWSMWYAHTVGWFVDTCFHFKRGYLTKSAPLLNFFFKIRWFIHWYTKINPNFG